MRQLLALSIAVATSLLLAACGSGSGVAVGPAPSALSYSAVVATYSVCETIQPNTPTLVGGASAFSVAPQLPTGLSVNPATGIISGTPLSPAPQAFYTITASNAAGQISSPVVIEVVLGTPPSELAYSTTEANSICLYQTTKTFHPKVWSLSLFIYQKGG